MRWLVKDLHEELKAWGRPGGGQCTLTLKADGEPAIVAWREALAKAHPVFDVPEVQEEEPETEEEEENKNTHIKLRKWISGDTIGQWNALDVSE